MGLWVYLAGAVIVWVGAVRLLVRWWTTPVGCTVLEVENEDLILFGFISLAVAVFWPVMVPIVAASYIGYLFTRVILLPLLRLLVP